MTSTNLLIILIVTILAKLSTQTPQPQYQQQQQQQQQQHYTIIASKQTNEIKPQPYAHYCGQAFVRAWRVACIVKQRYNLIFKRNSKGTQHKLISLRKFEF